MKRLFPVVFLLALSRQCVALELERCGDWGQPWGSSKNGDEICNYCYNGAYAWGQEPQDHMSKTTYRQTLADYIGHRNPYKIKQKMGADLTREKYNALRDDLKKKLDIFYLQDCRTGKSYYYGSHAATSSTIKCRYCNPTWQDCDVLVPKDPQDICGKDGLKCETCIEKFKRECRTHEEELRACPGCDADAGEDSALRRCPPERDMNFATERQLSEIPGVDDELAKMIVQARPVTGINDLAEKIRVHTDKDAPASQVLAAGRVLTTISSADGHSIELNQGLCYCKGGTSFECPKERDINRASKAELAAISGSDDALADLIIEHRGAVGYKTVAQAWNRVVNAPGGASYTNFGWRDGLCSDGSYPGCPYLLLDGECCATDKVVQGQCTDGKTTTTSITTLATTQDTEPTTTPPPTTTTTATTTTPPPPPTTFTTTTPAVSNGTTSTTALTTTPTTATTTTIKKTCEAESKGDDEVWTGSWYQDEDSVVITMTATKPPPRPDCPRCSRKYWVAIGFSEKQSDTWPTTMEVYMGENFSEQQVTAKHFDKSKSEYVSRSVNAVTSNIMASSCPETDTHITCTFKRKAKPQGLVAINTDIGIYWAYGRVLKNGPYFETERGEAVLKGCVLRPVRSPPLLGVTEQPQSMSDPDQTRQCWSASYKVVRGDGGNDGVQDVDSVDGTMSAGGPLCGQVGWVALVVSAQENNGPVRGDALVGALTWQKYRVLDEYVVASGTFKSDLRMEPRGTHDILDSECVRRVEGGLSCSFSKRLLTNDRYDVTSASNNVFFLYGGYDEQRKRVVTKTINLGHFQIKKSEVAIVRNPDIYPEDEGNPVGKPTKSTENDPGGVSTESVSPESGDSHPEGDPTQSPGNDPGGESTRSIPGPTEPGEAKFITDLARHVYQVTVPALVGLTIVMM